MNLLNIIQEIEKVDPEFQERINPRRAAIKNITSFGSKIALSALPFAMGTLFKKAYGQSNSSVTDVLNFALTLEYLEAEFYTQGTTTARNTIFTGQGQTAEDRTGLQAITRDENNHVTFLRTVLGSAAVAKPNFDFTAKGTFPTVFTNYDTFLAVAQVFEDTGVRAYKGQAGFLLGNQVVLTAALNIHSVEARHAAHVRQMRRVRTVPALKPWITGSNDTGIGAAVNGSFAGEENINQAGVDITKLSSVSGTISVANATEAFDEPLTRAQILTIVTPFFA